MQGSTAAPTCRCGQGPWIKTSMLPLVMRTGGKPGGAIEHVGCPSSHCLKLAAVIDGRIAEHTRTVPGPCPWVGVRIVDDGPYPPLFQRKDYRR